MVSAAKSAARQLGFIGCMGLHTPQASDESSIAYIRALAAQNGFLTTNKTRLRSAMPVRPGQPSCRSRLLDRSSWAHDGRLAHEQCRQADPISYRLLKRKTREEKDLVGATPAQPCARRRRGGVFSTAATRTIMVSAP